MLEQKILLIIGCSQKKLDYAAPVIDLNQGQLFRSVKKVGLKFNFEIMVLSGMHGLLRSNDVIEPYNNKIRTKTDILRVRRQISEDLLILMDMYDKIIVMMGKAYREVLYPFYNEKFYILYDKRGIGGYLSLFGRYRQLNLKQFLKEIEKFKYTNKIKGIHEGGSIYGSSV